MATRVSDEREHRRGLVLGLTMAEALILLVFLLLLALAALLSEKEDEIAVMRAREAESSEQAAQWRKAEETVKPVLDEAAAGQDRPFDAAALAALARRVKEAEKEAETSRKALEAADAKAAALDAKLAEFKPAVEAASRIDPQAPPAAVLEKGLQSLEKEAAQTASSRAVVASSLATMQEIREQAERLRKRNEELERKFAELQAGARLQERAPIVEAAAVKVGLKGASSELAAERKRSADLERRVAELESQRRETEAKAVAINEDGEKSRREVETLRQETARLRQVLADLRGRDGEAVEKGEGQPERQAFVSNGSGTTYPSCWADSDGRTEFLFDVDVTDRGVVVRNAASAQRTKDPAWTKVEPFARGAQIPVMRFREATARLFQWSKERDCRFFVNLRDRTRTGSKEAYQKFRRTVESHFYIRHLW